MSDSYLIVLRITVDDPDEDPRRWPIDEMLAAPPGEPDRHVAYVIGVKEDRS